MPTPRRADTDTDWRKPRGESPSRRRVRELTAQGLTPREIAAVMGVSPQNVYQHLKQIRTDEEAAV